MTNTPRKKSSFNKNANGRPCLAGDFFTTLNYRVADTPGGNRTLKSMQTQIKVLIKFDLPLDEISKRTEGTITKSYLSMIARGLHLGNNPQCRPRVIHAYALGVVYTNVIRDRKNIKETDEAISDLSEHLGKLWPKVRRVMKLRGVR